MTTEQFNDILSKRLDSVLDEVLKKRLELIRSVLSAKQGEYATNDDRLHNFNTASKELDGTPAENCWGFAKKHLVSIFDMVSGRRPVTKAAIDEKIGDAINYLILLECVLMEEMVK